MRIVVAEFYWSFMCKFDDESEQFYLHFDMANANFSMNKTFFIHEYEHFRKLM